MLGPKCSSTAGGLRGTDFEARRFYSVNGILTAQQTLEFNGDRGSERWIRGPALCGCAQPFSQSVGGSGRRDRAHLAAGVFYTLNPGGDAESANPIRSKFGTAATMDTVFAHAVFTCAGGHPQPLLEYSQTGASHSSTKQALRDTISISLTQFLKSMRLWPPLPVYKAGVRETHTRVFGGPSIGQWQTEKPWACGKKLRKNLSEDHDLRACATGAHY